MIGEKADRPEGPSSITVVTPVHERSEMVSRLLAGLSEAIDAFAQDGGSADVMLVDSSAGPEARRIQALAEIHRARVLRTANDVRHKRNQGIRNARGDVVLFVDSDCEADRRLLLEHAHGHHVGSAPDGRPVGGVLGLVTLSGAVTAAWRAADAAGFCDSFDFARRYPQAEWGPCANLSFRRELLVSLGGFREDWPRRLGGDDVELGMRVNASGYAILCRPSAVVRHDRGTWARWGAVAERAWRWGAMDVHVRMASAPGRLVPAGAGPEVYAAVLCCGTLLAAARHRSARPLLRALLVLPCVLVLNEPPRPPLVARVSGAALRRIFAVAALAEALRVRRPGVALRGLAPVDRPLAVRIARRRTAVTIAALMLTLPWVSRAPRAPRRG
jgi:Glycosyltransferase like family 2